MSGTMKRLLIYALALQPLFLIALLTYYFYGFRQYGSPAEYRKKQQEIMQAREDSLLALESVLSPRTVGDSTMVGLEMHTKMFEDEKRYERQMTEVKTVIDSLNREKTRVESIQSEVEHEKAVLDDLRQRALDEKIVNLAKIYDNMKAPQSAPLFIEMSDTLAVLIMTNMQERNASRVLGTIAEQDIDKATRLTRLLAMMGVIELK